MPPTLEPQQPFSKNLAYVLFNFIAIVFIAILGKEILCPLVFALLFSLVLLPIARFLEKRLHFRRALSSAVAVVLLQAFLIATVYFIATQLSGVTQDWPHFKQQLTTTLNSLENGISSSLHIDTGKQQQYIDNTISKASSSGAAFAGETLLSASSMLLFFVLMSFYLFFILYYRALLMEFFMEAFMKKAGGTILEIAGRVQQMIRKYVTGLLLEMLIVGAVCSLGFSLLGIKYALFLGPLTGILNVIPYVGIFTSLGITLLITIASAGAGKAAAVAAFVVAVHLTDSNLLLPFIVGGRVKINGLVTLLGVVAGELIWGIAGMFLSIPILAVAKIIVDHIDHLKHWGTLLGKESLGRKTLRNK
jgi:putative permease